MGYIIMTLDQLLMLTTVIDLGNVQAASQKLNKTQPAISKGLKQLEIQLQINILDRSEYRLKLTPEGKQIYSHAKRILAEADILQQVTTHLSQGNESEVSIAIDGAFDSAQLTPIFAKIQQKFPHTSLIIRQEYLTGAFNRLINDEVDIAISLKESALIKRQPLDYLYLNVQSLITVANPNILRRHANLTSVKQLKSEYLIMLQDSGSLTKGFEFGVLDGQRKYYVNDFATKKQLIVNDLGWGKLPEYMMQTELDNGNLVIITPEGNENRIDIEYYAIKKKILGPVSTYLWQTLAKSFG